MNLEFYCDHCDVRFVSEPDGTGYAQAPCPKCKYLAMTVAFHAQEKRRSKAEFLWFVGVIFSWPLTLLVFIVQSCFHKNVGPGGSGDSDG